jgi:hypothetical protein
MAYSGKFQPRNASKYKGKLDRIDYRSLWELKLMQKLDSGEQFVKWSSEEVIIPYFDPVKHGKRRRYYMDFWVKVAKPDGTFQEFLIEVKPHKESAFFVKAMNEGKEPSAPRPKPQNQTPANMARWYKEMCTASTNTAKWKAAIKYCKDHNMKFMIMDEHALGIDTGHARTVRKRTQTKNFKAAKK